MGSRLGRLLLQDAAICYRSMPPDPDMTLPFSLLSAPEVLEILDKASGPADVKAVMRRADESAIAKAWSMLNPAQRGALLLTRNFQGSSIVQNEDPVESDDAE